MSHDQKHELALPDDLRRFAQAQVDSGRFRSVIDVIRAAFAALQARGKLASLREAADVGFAQLDAGDYIEGSPAELLSKIRERADA
jgi:putative addiction module CopG family antidote